MRDERAPTLATPATGRLVPGRFLIFIGWLLTLGGIWVASGLFIPAGLQPLTPRLQGLVTIFLGIFVEALPFLLAGVLASSAIHLFVSPDLVQRISPRAPLPAALLGAMLGLAFPVCECGSIPTTRRLLAKGAPLPLGIAFVLAAAVVNPIVIVSTWVAFAGDPLVVVGRVVLTVVIAVLVGLLVSWRAHHGEWLAPPDTQQHGHDHDHDTPQRGGRLRALLDHSVAELFEMGRYLVIGALIAATLQVVIPRELMLALGAGPLVGTLTLMALAFVLSICSTVDAFVALAFVGTFPTGAVLAFLVFGPMIDIKALLMLTTTFSRRVVLQIALLVALCSAMAGMLITLALGGT
ncbi:MAG TPA: permease [Roseiflexaceae bacterium]|nr:permease [Roseiflexaceae bacterium]